MYVEFADTMSFILSVRYLIELYFVKYITLHRMLGIAWPTNNHDDVNNDNNDNDDNDDDIASYLKMCIYAW